MKSRFFIVNWLSLKKPEAERMVSSARYLGKKQHEGGDFVSPRNLDSNQDIVGTTGSWTSARVRNPGGSSRIFGPGQDDARLPAQRRPAPKIV